MNLKPKQLIINGKEVAIEELLRKKRSGSQWENDFYAFLKEWYSEKESIEVQSSGSTGKPKQILLKKDFIAASALRTLRFFRLKEKDKVLHCLPSKYIAGKLMLVRALIGKLDLILIDPASDFGHLGKESLDFAAMVPMQVSKLLESKEIRLRQLLIGGDAIPVALENQLQNLEIACYSSYGMTETATHIAIRKLNGEQADPFYHCLPGISVGLSENNCLQISMPGLPGSLLETTDIAEVENRTSFRILGRADNVIISGGIKFSPEKLEKKLSGEIDFPFMISSETHEKLGKQLVILLETKPNPELEKQLEQIFNRHLEKFERPRRIVYRTELPRTANGKLIRI